MIILTLGASIGAYAVIGWMLLRSRPETGQEQLNPTFLVLVVFLTIAPIWIRRTQLSEPRLTSVVSVKGLKGLIAHFMRVTTICGIVADSIGIVGLIASLLGGGLRYLLIFSAIALLVLARSYPSKRVWEQAAQYFSVKIPGTS